MVRDMHPHSTQRPGNAADAADHERGAALGRHLRALRKQRGWTQHDLCEKSGVSDVTLRSVENNYRWRNGRWTLSALSRALGLPADYLAEYRDNPPPEDLAPGQPPEDLVPGRPSEDPLPWQPATPFEKGILEWMDGLEEKIDTMMLLLLRTRRGGSGYGYPVPDSSGKKVPDRLSETDRKTGGVTRAPHAEKADGR